MNNRTWTAKVDKLGVKIGKDVDGPFITTQLPVVTTDLSDSGKHGFPPYVQ